MAQFRLTDKFAKDLKTSLNKLPEVTYYPLDDWIGDVFRIERKKVAILTHAQTFITFVFPYSEIGGAKNVLDFLPVELEDYLRSQDLDEHVEAMIKNFNLPPSFTKTNNRKILGYMSEFKRMVECSMNGYDVNWHDISFRLNDTIINIGGSSYRTPAELLNDHLKNCIMDC